MPQMNLLQFALFLLLHVVPVLGVAAVARPPAPVLDGGLRGRLQVVRQPQPRQHVD